MDAKFFKNEYIKIVIGVLWGLGLACVFRSACNGRNCIIYKAPKPMDVKNNIYGFDDKCYKYETVTTECDKTAINA
jgi:hypothetical protein